MDGTLFQIDKILEKSLDDTFSDLRSQQKWEESTPIEKYREIMGVALPQVWKTLLPTFSQVDYQAVDEYFLTRLIVNIRNGNGELYPHAIETFTSLKEKGYELFIASNDLTKYLQAIVDFYDLKHFFTDVCSIEQINSMNKQDLVKKIILAHHIESGVVVGDRLSDIVIVAAKGNDLLAVGCRFDISKPEELQEADKVIDDLLELDDFLSAVK